MPTSVLDFRCHSQGHLALWYSKEHQPVIGINSTIPGHPLALHLFFDIVIPDDTSSYPTIIPRPVSPGVYDQVTHPEQMFQDLSK